jgi:malonyl-CoA O-methyltransferase
MPSTAPRPFDSQAATRQLSRLSHAAQSSPWLHGEVAARMAERLPLIRLQPQRLLNWWEPFSGSAKALAAAYPQASCEAVINGVAREKNHIANLKPAENTAPWSALKSWLSLVVPQRPKLSTVWSEADDIASGAQLIWANMVLHSVADPLALMQRWHGLLEVDGFVMFSCLGPGSLLGLRKLYSQRGWPSPAAAFVDMHDLGDMLIEAGFSDPVMDQETLTLHWASAELLLSELRTLGGNAAPDRFAGLRTPRWHRALLKNLQDSLADTQGRLGLQFEVVYGHAFKATPRWKVGEQTQVPLNDLRDSLRKGRGLTK